MTIMIRWWMQSFLISCDVHAQLLRIFAGVNFVEQISIKSTQLCSEYNTKCKGTKYLPSAEKST